MREYAKEFYTPTTSIYRMRLIDFLIDFGEAAEDAKAQRKLMEKRQRQRRG